MNVKEVSTLKRGQSITKTGLYRIKASTRLINVVHDNNNGYIVLTSSGYDKIDWKLLGCGNNFTVVNGLILMII